MYSIICLFPWLPHDYNFRVAVMRVFNITTDQLVSVREERENNTVIFTVASQEIFNSLSEFYCCRILFFPLLGRNILECFAYPESHQYLFLILSDNSDYDTWDGFLSELGTVLYRRYLCDMMPLTSVFRTDTTGVVLLGKDEITALAIQLRPGNEQEDQPAATAMPNVPPAGPSTTEEDSDMVSKQLICLIENLQYLAIASLQSAFPYVHQRPEINTFAANEVDLYRPNVRRNGGRSGDEIHSSLIGLSSPAQAPVKEKGASQEPSPKETPAPEDKNQKPSSDKDEQE